MTRINAFDEMFGFGVAPVGLPRDVRPAYQPLRAWLEDSPHALMESRRRQAELLTPSRTLDETTSFCQEGALKNLRGGKLGNFDA